MYIYIGYKYDGGGVASIHKTIEGARLKIHEYMKPESHEDECNFKLSEWRSHPLVKDHYIEWVQYKRCHDGIWHGDEELKEGLGYCYIYEDEIND